MLVVFHAWRAVALLGSWSDVTSDTPLLLGDYGHYFYYAHVGTRALREQGTLWGYDPYFMAGYPKTLVFPTSSVYYELAVALVPSEWAWPAFKLSVYLAAVAGLPLLYLTGWLFRLSPRAKCLGVFLGLFAWWGGQAQEFVIVGLACYWMSLVLAAVGLGCLYRMTIQPRWYWVLASALAASASAWSHPLGLVVLTLAAAPFYLMRVGRLTVGQHAAWWSVAVLIAVAIAPLVLPALPFLSSTTATDVFYVDSNVHARLWALIALDRPIQWLLLVVGALGLYARRDDRAFARLVGTGVAVLFLISYLGSSVPLVAALQPVRYQAAVYWLLCIPAAVGFEAAYRWLQSTARSARESDRSSRTVLAPGIVAAVLALLVARLAAPSAMAIWHLPPPMVRPIPEGSANVLRILQEETSAAGRVLFEDITSKDRQNIRFQDPNRLPGGKRIGPRIMPLVHVRTGRECIGGPYYPGYLKHNFVRFGNATLCNRPMLPGRPNFLTDRLFGRYLDLYNILWVVAWSPVAQEYLDRSPHVERLQTTLPTGPYALYRTRRKGSFFEVGDGTVEAGWNRIVVRNAQPASDGTIVIRYHWLPTLRAESPVTMSPVRLDDDPVPFIRLHLRNSRPEEVRLINRPSLLW